MPIDDITGDGMMEMARGNTGTVLDACAPSTCHELRLTIPASTDVKTGVQFGQQGTELVGSYVGSGAAGYSRGRVVNA